MSSLKPHGCKQYKYESSCLQRLPPVKKFSDRVYLWMNLNLKNIIKLDTKNQKLISFGWFGATWKDEYLVWDEDAYEVTIH